MRKKWTLRTLYCIIWSRFIWYGRMRKKDYQEGIHLEEENIGRPRNSWLRGIRTGMRERGLKNWTGWGEMEKKDTSLGTERCAYQRCQLLRIICNYYEFPPSITELRSKGKLLQKSKIIKIKKIVTRENVNPKCVSSAN